MTDLPIYPFSLPVLLLEVSQTGNWSNSVLFYIVGGPAEWDGGKSLLHISRIPTSMGEIPCKPYGAILLPCSNTHLFSWKEAVSGTPCAAMADSKLPIMANDLQQMTAKRSRR